jgi:hypothetical protein
MPASTTTKATKNKPDNLIDQSPVEKGARLAGVLQITAANMRIAKLRIRGITPLVIQKFSQKVLEGIANRQEEGNRSRKGRLREPKDFNALYEAAKYISREGWHGMPCSAFRAAAVSACRLAGFHMTVAKKVVFVIQDGYDREDGTPLVRITEGQPHPLRMPVRNATGVADIRVRPMWEEWGAVVTLRFDYDTMSVEDVTNLMDRVGKQCGILEGRPDSKKSAGMGWGMFEVVEVIYEEERPNDKSGSRR